MVRGLDEPDTGENMKIAVCYPGDMQSVFMAAFQSIVNIEIPPGCTVKWFRGIGWCQARRRAHMCEQALDWGADLIAQLDIDQVYEPDVLCRLKARMDEGYRIVAAMVPGRCYIEDSKIPPFGRLAWRSTEDGQAFEPVNPNEGEMVRADFPTSACVMFHADDLRKLPVPWYAFQYDTRTWKIEGGEDGAFFLRMARMGVEAWVDTTIRVKHCHVFEIDETYPERFADWADGTGDPAICRFSDKEQST
jgi:hypothetical protein